ncbi:MAG: KOW domain-containing RNA-binding protein [Clostridia bacterium]|nr:KOW domain-containing RNA-binding protein [Clostridia bacterium]
MYTVEQGCVVRSKAGHDKGEFFVVVKDEGSFVLLCNGKERKLESPKKKNKRHVALTTLVLSETEMQTDCRLRRTLNQISASAKGGA